MKLFLAAGMDPNATDKDGDTALMHAARGRSADRLYAADEEVNTSRPRYAEIVKALLKGKADVNKKNRGASTALSWAASWGNIDTSRVLLDSGANAEAINEAFVAAAGSGRPEILRLLRDRNADVQKVGPEALRSAAGSGILGVTDTRRGEAVGFLLDVGVDVNARNAAGWTALLLAAERGYQSVVRILVDRGANLNLKCDCPGYRGGGWTALMLAIIREHRDVAQLLLDKGADVQVKSAQERTALMEAAVGRGRGTMVSALLEKGADVNAKDAEGTTALMLAAGNHDARTTVSALLGKGADVNGESVNGETALMAAARSGDPDVVRELLSRGAAPNERNRRGKTALALAQERRSADRNYEQLLGKATEIVLMLEQAGAR